MAPQSIRNCAANGLVLSLHCSRELAETSPYYEALKQNDVEVRELILPELIGLESC